MFEFPANCHNISILSDHQVKNEIKFISQPDMNFTKTKLLGHFVSDNVATRAKGNLFLLLPRSWDFHQQTGSG